jgi:cytoskeletal protein CcmA (bactofilin family)
MNHTVTTGEKPARSLAEIPPVSADNASRRPETRLAPRSVEARMTVGPGIKLKGEVSDCDTLVVEGTVDATLVCKVLAVSEGGTFSGTATVAEAEITGRFEGELTVSGVLQVRSSGHVTGAIRYGRIEVESGGEISGTVTRQESSRDTDSSRPPAPRRDPHPGIAR